MLLSHMYEVGMGVLQSQPALRQLCMGSQQAPCEIGEHHFLPKVAAYHAMQYCYTKLA
jgi:hypothetical protein